MSGLANKKILLGVTGGIACYKSAVLLRALQSAEAEVRVVMTPAAQAFVTPLTFQALSGHPVYTELLDPAQEAAMDHISLARWADLVVIAPATADFMARVATGQANDLLATLCLATETQIVLAPAMNRQMWLNSATQDNLQRLIQRGYLCWGPDDGAQACGETGPGRMLEPEALCQLVENYFSPGTLQGVKVLITAGATREPIDPVRYVGNRSSGKMGYAVAESMRDLGAEVTLVSGPTALTSPSKITTIQVETAAEMYSSVMAHVDNCDIFIAVAAVADYRPNHIASDKIKKNKEILALELVKNPDILAEVAAKNDPPFTVGFAAETDQVEQYADEKRRRKQLDMIAANRVGSRVGGFESDQNALLLLWQDGREELPMMEKSYLAQRLAERIAKQFHARN
ncbi:MAG: bifunctional 4'-phosphopantothenoylcysteine decarboxylase/phosphopantothenoylcysteine synthetase [gamma proteobacterium symbiont of Ctena orbiculata]|nr:MAG: bifunctional 4'-phosphopantothenoylcysteine decarboxylase/phosphopantothenoylcysteine synthetase [gamma proteobacterium symbiont of Ctena orbiculata]PVV23277.1 MAG: bifunctional 4'-phosphopantothenoylcysteine decarboxylase/phosphopantothenoylcysteine synthetase [gamma proteobacterium symbiont of Ctena orbiculata]PVV26764.1 MAG: bifunctional 4'-phosphopantothenoylcysteine decarboxylase/phosphopantothenoylcysteine synthetase [gamma proteobacterium symbiont of Ctena orbiculata]